jgi:hypothetical protein
MKELHKMKDVALCQNMTNGKKIMPHRDDTCFVYDWIYSPIPVWYWNEWNIASIFPPFCCLDRTNKGMMRKCLPNTFATPPRVTCIRHMHEHNMLTYVVRVFAISQIVKKIMLIIW